MSLSMSLPLCSLRSVADKAHTVLTNIYTTVALMFFIFTPHSASSPAGLLHIVVVPAHSALHPATQPSILPHIVVVPDQCARTSTGGWDAPCLTVRALVSYGHEALPEHSLLDA